MALRRRSASEGLNAWPGYVDALSTLLMVIIFVLLVFVLAQAFLGVALSNRDQVVDSLKRSAAELSDMLSLERDRSSELRLSVTQLGRDLQSTTNTRDSLAEQIAALRGERDRVSAERDALRNEHDQLAARVADQDLQATGLRDRNAGLQKQAANAGEAMARLEATRAELERTVQADRATIEARLGDLQKLRDDVQGLTALRDQLERQAQDAAARATTEAERRTAVEAQLADTQKLSGSDKAELARLSADLEEVRTQLATVQSALDSTPATGSTPQARIADLGARLNAELVGKVGELQRYRSAFFEKLSRVLQGRAGIQVVGDRFVFQSEVLFPAGSADMTGPGQDQIRELAKTLKAIGEEIPADVNWVLRVDGHADRTPVGPGRYADNWDLSAARAIRVVKLLIAEGVDPARLAATGFGEFQPLDKGETPDAYARNRRIEIRLTDR